MKKNASNANFGLFDIVWSDTGTNSLVIPHRLMEQEAYFIHHNVIRPIITAELFIGHRVTHEQEPMTVGYNHNTS